MLWVASAIISPAGAGARTSFREIRKAKIREPRRLQDSVIAQSNPSRRRFPRPLRTAATGSRKFSVNSSVFPTRRMMNPTGKTNAPTRRAVDGESIPPPTAAAAMIMAIAPNDTLIPPANAVIASPTSGRSRRLAPILDASSTISGASCPKGYGCFESSSPPAC